MIANIKKDSFELALDEKKALLQECQASKNSNSCYECESIFNCETRSNYVKAVYDSMSKGKTDGGFEF
ncbi:hypothetical protein [Campylobacter troglodytis]|uniref:hypothetical protein n=1 Tax=Campylobacter troglodytis TaxID=654363 RepID=UPI00115B7F92|nr:hypothetical protein [Campylobacter troglodytis]TQR60230.1 hypothetical protein DMC01_06590 [Campylobacter troglodytis]